MRNVRRWRKMTWSILFAVVLGVAWVVGSGFSLFIIGVSLGILGLLWLLRYFTEPLWRQGRGVQARRQPAPVAAFKSMKNLVEPRPAQD